MSILRGKTGLRTGWRVLVFLALLVVFYLASQALLGRIAPLSANGGSSLTTQLIRRSVYALLMLAAVWIMAAIEHRPVRSYGYAFGGALMRFVSGLFWGFAALSAVVGVLRLHGSLVFDGVALGGAEAGLDAIGVFGACLLVGFMEETQLRGYLQFTLARAIGFWWAALILSVAFGLGHLHNSHETVLGVLTIGASGAVFCLSLWYTRTLYWAIGFHAAWDWGQAFFYGDRGDPTVPQLFATHPVGDPLWSRGLAGPEASLVVLPRMLALLVGMGLWWGHGKPALSLREAWDENGA